VKAKKRNHFDVLKCRKKHCPYRHDIRLRLEAIRNGASPKAKSYIYRSFDLQLTDLQLKRPNKPKLDCARLRHSTTAVALALTFHIHFGLSLRETQQALLSLYQLPLSHQTIANWCQSVAYLVEPLVSERIEDADILVGDETFISISGDDAYWWISYNPETATIVSQLVSTTRDTKAAATLIRQSHQQAPQLSYFISDAWDAYALALLYLGQQQDNVPQHIIVTGLQYRGVPEDAFLWDKELIERFFRTFKQRYRRTLGFASINGAVAFCVLFSVYYNYFRPHQRADGEAPVSTFNQNNVLRNWQQLIQMAIQQA
jgi:transposase-like protein